jgi:hypothetical protein
VSQAAIAAISGLIPTMFITRVRFISQNRECHLGGYFWKRFGEEVCRSYAGLHRAERMLDYLSTLAHASGFASSRCCVNRLANFARRITAQTAVSPSRLPSQTHIGSN